MEGLKHTKGPWSYTILGPHRNNKDVLAIEINYGKDGECIADTVYEEADARLIAAAPVMLESMIRAYRELIGVSRLQDWHSESFRAVIEEMERTIEAATNMKIEEVLEATARQEAER